MDSRFLVPVFIKHIVATAGRKRKAACPLPSVQTGREKQNVKEKGTVKLRWGIIKEVQGLVNDSPVTMNSPPVLLFHTWCLYVTTLGMLHFLLLDSFWLPQPASQLRCFVLVYPLLCPHLMGPTLLLRLFPQDEREARETVKREQDEAYRVSLEADRKKVLSKCNWDTGLLVPKVWVCVGWTCSSTCML